MAPDNDPMAVVDQYCRVRGVQRLRVVDASIVPNIVRATTNLTCIMIGERVADWTRNSD
jgi:choline dehydrogenase